jgi:murein DD-endopeptidase MepM/ murein hydrolase activator NlpD
VALRSGFVLPSAAAAALVVTATGATVAETAPAAFDLTTTSKAKEARERSSQQAELAMVETEQQRAVQAAGRARAAEAERVARSAERAAVAKKTAAAAALRKAEAQRKAREKWVQPIKGAAFTSGYGWRWGRMHEGNDFGTPVGTPLASMSTGTVVFAGYEGGYGNKLEIEYWDGTVSVYGHMSQISVSVGDKVAPSEIVGYSGNTGHSTGPHLHLEIHPDGGSAIDPAPWLHAHGLQ